MAAVGPSGTDLMLPYDFLHVVPRQSAPDWIKSNPLSTGDAGAVPSKSTGTTMQHVRYPNVFSLGDVASSPERQSRCGRAGNPVSVRRTSPHLSSPAADRV